MYITFSINHKWLGNLSVYSLWFGKAEQSDRQTGRQTDRQTGSQADSQTGRQSDRQAGRQSDRQIGRQADRQTGRQVDRQTGRQAVADVLAVKTSLEKRRGMQEFKS